MKKIDLGQTLGIRLLLGFEETYQEMTGGQLDEGTAIRQLRAVYHRDRLNYGAPIAWPAYRVRADPGFIEFMDNHVIGP